MTVAEERDFEVVVIAVVVVVGKCEFVSLICAGA